MGDHPLQIMYLASEAEPFVKVGGLGDVAGSLPAALRGLGAAIRLVIPLHGSIDQRGFQLRKVCEFPLNYQNNPIPVEVYSTQLGELPVYFISSPLILREEPVYSADAGADVRKFVFFSLATLRLASEMGWSLDILHANDWHTALAVYALAKSPKLAPTFEKTGSVLSVHNLPYLGASVKGTLKQFGFAFKGDAALPVWARDLPMPLGLLAADRIVAVSPGYAKEILTPAYGSGLELFLKSRSNRISGILNGLDLQQWNPDDDSAIPVCYDFKSLGLRAENKAALQSGLGLPVDSKTIMYGIVSRMDYQKGIDLILEAFRRLPLLLNEPIAPWQLVFLGTGSPEIEADARMLQVDFPNRVRVITRFDTPLSRLIYAGADLMLIPSRYEPCGLTQMIAMRYGCVPLGRATGGLRDTILDFNDCKDSTGFLFEESSPEALVEALTRARRIFTKPVIWRRIQERGMQTDFSWKRSAQEYLDLYKELVREKGLEV